jgi:hypothetical protein
MKKCIFIIICFLTVLPLSAEIPQLSQGPISVSFIYSNEKSDETTLGNMEIHKILKDKPLSKDIRITGYKIDFWIYGALQKLSISFKQEINNGKVTITKIGEITNSEEGKWVYYVNGKKSSYNINTQTDEGVKTIKFVFEKITKK